MIIKTESEDPLSGGQGWRAAGEGRVRGSGSKRARDSWATRTHLRLSLSLSLYHFLNVERV